MEFVNKGSLRSMKGNKELTTANNENNTLQFIIQQSLLKLNTVKVVEVVEVYDDTVDVKPCLNFLNGDLNMVEPNIVFSIPFFTYQCGIKAFKIKPVVGDWGCLLVCDKDISKIKKTKARANPDTLRRFNLGDGLYIGSFINKRPATEYIEITESTININSSSTVNINSPVVNLGGVGGKGVARLDDEVEVVITSGSSAGTYRGKITKASSTTKTI